METALIAAVVSGLVSSLGTIAALKVHITYLRETLERHEKAIQRAHDRLDEHEKAHRPVCA